MGLDSSVAVSIHQGAVGVNRGGAMPLASLLKKHDFEDDTTRLLTESFDQAWAKIVASRSPLGDEDNASAARFILANWMIAKAKAGERNRRRLVADAIEYMARLKLPLPGSEGLPPKFRP